MPTCAVTNQENLFLGILLGQLLQKYVHTIGIAPWQNQKETVPGARIDRANRITVLPDMMAGHSGPDAACPAILWRVDSSKTCLVLKHDAHWFVLAD